MNVCIYYGLCVPLIELPDCFPEQWNEFIREFEHDVNIEAFVTHLQCVFRLERDINFYALPPNCVIGQRLLVQEGVEDLSIVCSQLSRMCPSRKQAAITEWIERTLPDITLPDPDFRIECSVKASWFV